MKKLLVQSEGSTKKFKYALNLYFFSSLYVSGSLGEGFTL